MEKPDLNLINKVKRILDKSFKKAYSPNRTPVEQAVFTVLSQNTTDLNAEKCLENLKLLTKGDLLKISKLSETSLLNAIKPCGLFKQKTTALKKLMESWPILEEKLKKLPSQKAIELLTSFPYVGSKTARVILLFGFNKNAFPIDTHCKRVLKRLGLFPESWKPDKISSFMEDNFDVDFNRKFHYDLIRIGRKYCKPRKPSCKECPLKEVCEYAKRNLLFDF